MFQYLQPFGRKCYVHVPVEKRPPGTKLLPRAVEGIFVGYTDSTKIYRIYVPSRHKIEVTRQVRFAPLDTAENDRKNIKPIPSQVTTSNDQSFEIEAVDTTPMIISQIRKGKDKQPQPESEPEDNESEKSQTPQPESEPEDNESEKSQTPQPESEPEDNESEKSQTPQPESEPEDNEISQTPQPEPVRVIPPGATVTQFGRISRPVAKYATALIDDDPETYIEALRRPESEEWQKAMDTEIEALKRNDTYTVVPIPKGRKLVDSKWVYKTKYLADGSVEQLKARGVAKGYSQIPGQDFDETFAPVVRYESLRLLLAISAQKGWKPRQYDVKSAFLYGRLQETIYMRPLQGYREE